MAVGAKQDIHPQPIHLSYLLIVGLSCYIDSNEQRWVEDLWHRDLLRHLDYLPNLILASPLCHESPHPNFVCLSKDEAFKSVRYVDLPDPRSFVAALLALPVTIFRIWRAVGYSQVVHTGLANWPIPFGW